MTIKLNLQSLQTLAQDVSVPTYRRSQLSPGIVHIGVGNFHRAHQAMYLHRLFELGEDLDWAIIGAGIRPTDALMREKLREQDWMSTVIELQPDSLTASVTGSMVDFIEVNAQALIEALSQPQIRIVSLTITEGGYFVDATDGGFQADHPDMIADAQNPAAPKTVFGILLAGLQNRRASGLAPFTVMSCDNLPQNGIVAHQAMLGLASMISADLAGWVDRNVVFPNSMVDCITPATSQREIETAAREFNIADASPVACEPFRQWVLEDRFPAGRPALEKVGVEFVRDVAPYELMKLRILNGGHAAIAYPAALMGIDFVHDAMAEPLIVEFLDRLEEQEIMPTVPPVNGVDFDAYFSTVKQRFSNPAVGDTIPRLCLDGSNRQPKFILPTIADRLEAGLPVEGLALEIALWCRYCAGTNDAGQAIDIVDEHAQQLKKMALEARTDPLAFLTMEEIFGALGHEDVFVRSYSTSLQSLWQNGTRQTLAAFNATIDVTLPPSRNARVH